MKKIFFLAISLLIAAAFAQNYAQAKRNFKTFRSDVLTQWMDLHCGLIKSTKGIGHVAYSNHFAYTGIAVYEACHGSNKQYISLSNQLNGLKGFPAARSGTYWPASVTAAYSQMLRHFYRSFEECIVRIDSLQAEQEKMFAVSGIATDVLKSSKDYGDAVATAVTDWAKSDNSIVTTAFTLQEGEGLWKPTPPAFAAAALPYWGDKRGFTNNLLTIADVLKSPVYSSDSNAAFYKMAKEVYDVSVSLTPEQKATALYWDDSPNGSYISVFGHWTSILSSIIKSKQLSLVQAAEAYAKMSMSMHEASIVTWRGKYKYNVLRPVTYIQSNFDKDWLPVIPTPPHPEFPAAHATLSYSAATALCALFGEHCAFTDATYISLGMPARSYTSVKDAAREAGMSRLYGGIHYRYSIEQGFVLGERAARHVLRSVKFK
ncbi:MAG: vanadium-dependent haloperoxidase [Chitinophagaceae bacterium]